VPSSAQTAKLDPNSKAAQAIAHTANIRQSLILIEEADILFEEDKGFWAALIELIGRSRRPVIITCNDPSSIPVHDLPLQTTLSFEPPAAEEAVPLLQLMALREGNIISRADMTRLYDSTSHIPDPNSLTLGGIAAFGAMRRSAGAALFGVEKVRERDALELPDLRLAINELQFWCSSLPQKQGGAHAEDDINIVQSASSTSIGTTPEQDHVEDPVAGLLHAYRCLDSLSFADANFRPGLWDIVETCEPDIYHPLLASAARDQVQNEQARPIHKAARRDECQILAECGVEQAEEFRSAVSSLASSLWPSSPADDEERRSTWQRLQYTEDLFRLAGDGSAPPLVSNLSVNRPSSEALVVDYAPHLRAMVQIDDQEAKRHDDEVQAVKAIAAMATAENGSANPLMQLRLTRNTRNSQQSLLTAYGIHGGETYARYIYADEGVLDAVRRGRFPEAEGPSLLAVDSSVLETEIKMPAQPMNGTSQIEDLPTRSNVADGGFSPE